MKLRTQFEFDAAHRLVGYDGKCSNLHGHIWKVELEIEGNELDDNGILWDFSNTKKIKELFDHKTILKRDQDNNQGLIDAIEYTCGIGSVYVMDENPTAENLCYEIFNQCILSNPKLKYKVRVWESSKSYAEVTV